MRANILASSRLLFSADGCSYDRASKLLSSASPLLARNFQRQQHRRITRAVAPDVSREADTKEKRGDSPLRVVPFLGLLRSLLVLTAGTLPPSAISSLARTARKHAGLLESSRALQLLVRTTFYKHFCVGATRNETTRSIQELRNLGINGVVLAFAREATAGTISSGRLEKNDPGLSEWTALNLKTVEKLTAGDFIALRLTGAGASAVKFMEDFTAILARSSEPQAVYRLGKSLEAFQDSLHTICSAARNRDVRVLIDAEGSSTQAAIDFMALNLMRKFNGDDFALVLNTYQMYLKSNLSKIKSHLSHSIEHKYHLGLKLVRGAYIHTETKRHLIHDAKPQTDEAFDGAVDYLLGNNELQRNESSAFTPEGVTKSPWSADVMLATHNTNSVKRALSSFERFRHQAVAERLGRSDPPPSQSGVRHLMFAQLMGMADEVSLELVENMAKYNAPGMSSRAYPLLGVYKYSVWGTLSECLLYMLRRAEENQDAVARTRETALAVLKELLRRLRFW